MTDWEARALEAEAALQVARNTISNLDVQLFTESEIWGSQVEALESSLQVARDTLRERDKALARAAGRLAMLEYGVLLDRLGCEEAAARLLAPEVSPE
jgi:hypothetical protein